MAVTAASFVSHFPAFRRSGDALIEAKLAEAQELIDEPAWGVLYDQAVRYMAAHLMSLEPLGEPARGRKENGESVYLMHLDRLYRQLPVAMQVL